MTDNVSLTYANNYMELLQLFIRVDVKRSLYAQYIFLRSLGYFLGFLKKAVQISHVTNESE